MAQAEATVLIDNNESVRATRWQLPPGTAVGFHRHDFDYVIVPLTTARIELRSSRRVRRDELSWSR